ncbi:MAG: hypothetical protein GX491_00805 [Chloroflexi bacterium]|nr:hypothetical protein [Chloroflexota bacterium]
MTEKLSLVKELKHLYSPSAKAPALVEVPPLNFLMIDGRGDPNTSPAYQEAIEALYSLSYTLKFAIKKAEGLDYAVGPLEGLWWVPDMREFSVDDKSSWYWTMMIAQPPPVDAAWVERARAEAVKKKGLPAIEQVRFEVYEEGLAAQIMHIGPFAEEGPNIARLHSFIKEQGCELTGKHHEIYLSDFRRTAPERLKTIIRQPAKRLN